MSKGVPKGESYNLVRERLSIQLYTGRGAPRNQDNKENIFGIIMKYNSFYFKDFQSELFCIFENEDKIQANSISYSLLPSTYFSGTLHSKM